MTEKTMDQYRSITLTETMCCWFCEKPSIRLHQLEHRAVCETCFYTVMCECGRWAISQPHECLWKKLQEVG